MPFLPAGCFGASKQTLKSCPAVIGAESSAPPGSKVNPTAISHAGGTGHTESVRVTYDPSKLSYAQLVDYFWHHIDPTVKDRQFCDSGTQYRSESIGKMPTSARLPQRLTHCWPAEKFKEIHTEIIARPRSTPPADRIPSGLLAKEN